MTSLGLGDVFGESFRGGIILCGGSGEGNVSRFLYDAPGGSDDWSEPKERTDLLSSACTKQVSD